MLLIVGNSVWGIVDGVYCIIVDIEILIYVVFDIFVKFVFGFWFFFSYCLLVEINVDVGGWWFYGLGVEGRIRIGDEE